MLFTACEQPTPISDIADPLQRAIAVSHVDSDDWERLPELFAFLSDPASVVREDAVWVLGRTGSPLAVGPLADAATNDSDPDVRAAACHALGRLGFEDAIAPLINLWSTFRSKDDAVIHLLASDALVEIGPAAIEPVLAVTQDPDWRVRAAAAKTLGLLPRRSASISALRRLVGDNRAMVDYEARRALELLGAESP